MRITLFVSLFKKINKISQPRDLGSNYNPKLAVSVSFGEMSESGVVPNSCRSPRLVLESNPELGADSGCEALGLGVCSFTSGIIKTELNPKSVCEPKVSFEFGVC